MRHFRAAAENRANADGATHHRSSRSHSVLTLAVEQPHAGGGGTVTSRLTLVDLAGSERSSGATAPAAGAGKQRETASINRSLTVLRRVVAALAEGGRTPPYRESTTRKRRC